MILKRISLMVIGMAVCIPAFAAKPRNNPPALGTSGTMKVCGGNMNSGCIGISQVTNGCKPGWGIQDLLSAGQSKEYMMQMMVAHKINSNGAQFCPTQVESQYHNNKRGVTIYNDLSDGNKDVLCHWLCRDGYSGEGCNTAASSSSSNITCDTRQILRSDYAGIPRNTQEANIEYQIPMYDSEVDDKCGGTKKDEHDIILAISRFLESGHGAFAQRMVVRAHHQGKKNDPTAIEIYPAQGANEVLLCKSGYKPNSAKTDCEPVVRTACAETEADKLAALCGGFQAALYDSANHTLVLDDAKNCYKYLCSEPGLVFKAATDTTCITCEGNLRGGPSDDGLCVKCPAGTVYSADAKSSNYCVEALQLSKTDMLYGRGKTKNSTLEPCYYNTEPSEFRNCVMGTSGN